MVPSGGTPHPQQSKAIGFDAHQSSPYLDILAGCYKSLKMENFLRFLAIFGSATGMVPGKFAPKWGLRLGRAYCVLCLSYFTLMTVDYWANVGPSFFGDYTANSTPPLSYQVTNIAILFTYAFDMTVIRLNTLYHSREFFTLLHNFQQLRQRLVVTESYAPGQADGFGRVVFIVMSLVASAAYYVNKYFQIQKYYQIMLSDDFRSWYLPRNSHLSAILAAIPDVMHGLVFNFALMEFTLLVLTFLDLYVRYGHLLLTGLQQTSGSKHDHRIDGKLL